MARPRNQSETITIPISTTPAIVEYLERLVATGFYGTNRTVAAERILAASVKELVRAGEVERIVRKKAVKP